MKHLKDNKPYFKRISHIVDLKKTGKKLLEDNKKQDISNLYDDVLGFNKEVLDNVKDELNKYVSLVIEEDKKYNLIYDFESLDTLIDYHEVIVKEGVKAKLDISYLSDRKVYHNGVLKVTLEKNANLDLIYTQILNEESLNYYTIYLNSHEKSKLNISSICFGALVNAISIRSKLLGDESSVHMTPIYFADKNRKYDLEYTLNFYGKNSEGIIDARGTTKDNAQKIFRGNLIFEKGSTKSVGEEKEFSILLSKELNAQSIPTLFCHEDDVIGAHAANIGNIDENKLFYLMSRGLSSKEAKKLVILSSIGSVLDKLEEDIKERILKELDDRI